MVESKKSTEKEVIKTCIDLALQNVEHGCLFVIELNGKKRSNYYTKVFKSLKSDDGNPLSVTLEEDKHIIKHLSRMDGCTIIDSSGEMREFGVTLKNNATFFGHGKRHAFALGTSRLSNTICILSSQEDKHIRLFRDGVCVAEIDSKSYVPSALRHKLVDLLDTPLSKVLVASGIRTSISKLNPMPAIVTITGSDVMVSYGFDKLKKLF
jgi:DNA integrity scanning protein DisA with diadenylate cyclase activity